MFRGAGVAVVAAWLAGCAYTVNPKYAPGPLPTAWEGRKPKIYLGLFSDKTTGVLIKGTAGYGRSMRLAPATSDSLKDAFRTAFQRLSVPVVASSKEADAVVSAALQEVVVDMPSGYVSRDHAAMKLAVTVKTPEGAPVYADEVVGKADGPLRLSGMPGEAPVAAVQNALAAAMKSVEDVFMAEVAEQIFLAQKRSSGAAPQVAAASRSDVDDVPKLKTIGRRGHAVVIGVERYRQQLPSADFAASDARLVAKYFQGLGLPPENVAVLTNDGATRGDMEKYLERWLANRVEPGDAVFVYYSGHGAPNPTTGDAYLVPFDGDPMYLDQTAYPLNRLYGALAKLPSKNVTVVLDSCFSGTGGRSVIAKGARPLVQVKAMSGIPPELTVLAAASANQISQSYQSQSHGLFTYWFLKGLAAHSADMKKVFDFAAPEVSRVAKQDYNSEQTPLWHGGDR